MQKIILTHLKWGSTFEYLILYGNNFLAESRPRETDLLNYLVTAARLWIPMSQLLHAMQFVEISKSHPDSCPARKDHSQMIAIQIDEFAKLEFHPKIYSAKTSFEDIRMRLDSHFHLSGTINNRFSGREWLWQIRELILERKKRLQFHSTRSDRNFANYDEGTTTLSRTSDTLFHIEQLLTFDLFFRSARQSYNDQ